MLVPPLDGYLPDGVPVPRLLADIEANPVPLEPLDIADADDRPETKGTAVPPDAREGPADTAADGVWLGPRDTEAPDAREGPLDGKSVGPPETERGEELVPCCEDREAPEADAETDRDAEAETCCEDWEAPEADAEPYEEERATPNADEEPALALCVTLP